MAYFLFIAYARLLLVKLVRLELTPPSLRDWYSTIELQNQLVQYVLYLVKINIIFIHL